MDLGRGEDVALAARHGEVHAEVLHDGGNHRAAVRDVLIPLPRGGGEDAGGVVVVGGGQAPGHGGGFGVQVGREAGVEVLLDLVAEHLPQVALVLGFIFAS